MRCNHDGATDALANELPWHGALLVQWLVANGVWWGCVGLQRLVRRRLREVEGIPDIVNLLGSMSHIPAAVPLACRPILSNVVYCKIGTPFGATYFFSIFRSELLRKFLFFKIVKIGQK